VAGQILASGSLVGLTVLLSPEAAGAESMTSRFVVDPPAQISGSGLLGSIVPARGAPSTPAEAAAPGRVGTITGRVVEEQTLQPIASAQVFIEELDLGVLTRADGGFQLVDVPNGVHQLRVQSIGYRTAVQQVTVQEGLTVEVDFTLGRQALALDAIVVTGTAGGTQRRAIGNVVSTLDAANITEVSPAVNMEQLLGERMPGVMVMPSSGGVGRDAGPIRIRGSSSTSLSNDPIVYIDGIRMNSDRPYQSTSEAGSRLNDLNPADIESIEVIKGPAAATLYGTEASNGVIQIITKRGTTGAPTFDATIEVGASWLADPDGKASVNYGTNPMT